MNVQNVAEGNAHVGQQFGVIHGDANFYFQVRGSVPEGPERFRVGRNYLNSDAPRRAQELIHEAVARDYRSTEVAYYWLLAILSGRSLDHLDQDELEQLTTASTMAAQFPPDQWSEACATVYAMIQCLFVQERGDELDVVAFQQVLGRYRALAPERRDEIYRHLNMIMTGGVQDQIDQVEADGVRQNRAERDRLHRVPKFFMPTPAEPRLLPVIAESQENSTLVGLVFGIGTLVVALLVGTPLIFRASWFAGLFVLVLFGAGGWALANYGSEYRWIRQQRLAAQSRFGTSGLPIAYRTADTGFVREVAALVEQRFHDYRPQGTDERYWMEHTAGIRSALTGELVQLYGWDRGPNSPEDIDWLIIYHTQELARQWTAGTFYAERDRWTVPPLTGAAYFGGMAAVGLAALVATVSMFAASPLGGLGALVLLIPGLLVTWQRATAVLVAKRIRRESERRRDARWAEDHRAYERWLAYLADIPADWEMAQWLDYDKSYIKTEALKTFGLSNRDIIGHVTLTSAAPNARRARCLYGPPRYSQYDVRLFLLTERGVREVNTRLEFATGMLSDEHRRSFRYDALSSADVEEVGVQFDSGRREVVALDRAGQRQQIATHRLTLARALKLTLNNGQQTFVLIENFDLGFLDRMRENLASMEELARDTAGVSGALRILEAIAAEGSEWLAEERRRRNRRLATYQDRHRARPGALGGTPDGRYQLPAQWPGSDVPAARDTRSN